MSELQATAAPQFSHRIQAQALNGWISLSHPCLFILQRITVRHSPWRFHNTYRDAEKERLSEGGRASSNLASFTIEATESLRGGGECGCVGA